MHQPNEMKALNDKLADLQNLFKVGEKIIPSIQKLIEFMVEIVPLLSNINSSIEETNSKIPKASDHIYDVTSATEIATTEILDKVDEIFNEVTVAEETYNYFSERYIKMQVIIEKLKVVVSDNPEAVQLVEQIIELNGHEENNSKIQGAIEKVKQYLQEITITLQVQDITAQQLSSVNHLITSVQKRLSSLIVDISGEGLKVTEKANEVIIPTTDNFDPNASFNRDGQAQQLANELVVNNQTSQDEIDKLFGNNGN
jgi:chemotaxis regulatin CheY-phosphate phosphatase CheZ